uniref:Uncharacterized protein n=1 Tax=Candidatus Kentrum sp. FW TaxID=2126338 RepID=A0A450TMY7_9GAMM|nr:MAG: hypothetical protein BECKFW1821B_GA0114236_11591 [Candidatus Kentron sp. FW]
MRNHASKVQGVAPPGMRDKLHNHGILPDTKNYLNGHEGTSVTPENETPLGWLGSSAASPQMFFHSNGNVVGSDIPDNERAPAVSW